AKEGMSSAIALLVPSARTPTSVKVMGGCMGAFVTVDQVRESLRDDGDCIVDKGCTEKQWLGWHQPRSVAAITSNQYPIFSSGSSRIGNVSASGWRSSIFA